MMMKTAGGPGAVSPLDFAERKRPMPRWMWIAIGVSALAHVGVGAWLYYQRFEMPVMATPDETPPIQMDFYRPKPKPLPPVTDTKPPAPNTVIHETPLPTRPTETSPAVPNDAETQADGPITVTHPVETPPAETPVTTRPNPPADPVIRNPQWVRRPSAEQLLAAYPDRALERGIAGRATLSCGVRADGSMVGCSVISESPSGNGFGRAALGLSRHFRLSPQTVDGRVVEGARVSIPLSFTVPSGN